MDPTQTQAAIAQLLASPEAKVLMAANERQLLAEVEQAKAKLDEIDAERTALEQRNAAELKPLEDARTQAQAKVVEAARAIDAVKIRQSPEMVALYSIRLAARDHYRTLLAKHLALHPPRVEGDRSGEAA